MATAEAVTRSATLAIPCPACGDDLSVSIEFSRHYSRGRYTGDTLISALADDFRHNRCDVGDLHDAAATSLAAISTRVRADDRLHRAERARWR